MSTYSTLVTTDLLAAHLDDPDWVIVDCRFDLGDTARGEGDYVASHIPGAVYAHLDRDLSGELTGRNGRHPLPRVDDLVATLGRWGIARGVQVVAYDQDAGHYAGRLWWLLRFVGHEAAAVLDGGFAKWTREARPTRSGREANVARPFEGRPDRRRLATVDEVERLAGDASHRLIDARAPERYSGLTEPLDPLAGHIPGAANYFFRQNLSPEGTFLSPDALRMQLSETLGQIPPDRAIVYCGSGVTACHDLLALEHAGLYGARLYAGSWSEWCSDARRPIETEEPVRHERPR